MKYLFFALTIALSFVSNAKDLVPSTLPLDTVPMPPISTPGFTSFSSEDIMSSVLSSKELVQAKKSMNVSSEFQLIGSIVKAGDNSLNTLVMYLNSETKAECSFSFFAETNKSRSHDEPFILVELLHSDCK